MANQTPWVCPEDGTRNTGSYCSHCGRQRPKYATSDNSVSGSTGSNILRDLVIIALVIFVFYKIGNFLASPESENILAYYDWDWIDATIQEGSSTLTVSAAGFNHTLRNVKSFTVYMDVEMYANTSCKDWQVWIRRSGSYERAAKIYLPDGKGEVTQTVTLSSPASFDAIAITPTVPGGYSWSMTLGLSDFRTA